jgi:dipeptidyl aminopeptidase/acylaminoacyl peptidase
MVATYSDVDPGTRYLFDRRTKKLSVEYVSRERIPRQDMAAMKPISYPSSDGLVIPAYLTLPKGLAAKGLPLVVFPHGGPWARDSWGFNGYAQWLANRGYAVMQVNFRGSTGYGKKFLNAGNKQWGKAMHTDLLDAVDWTVKQGWVDANKVAVMGGSYGGYSALAGVTFTPDVFKCSVDIVGPSNLFTLLQSIPPYWAPMIAQFHQRMGDPKTDEALLKAASPLFSADKIKVPLLIGQGANDPRVKQAESEQIVAAIEKNGGGVTYVLYPDEGHGFARPENRIDFNARAEAFLATCLGGRVEPLPAGDKVPGSTAVVKVVAPKAK